MSDFMRDPFSHCSGPNCGRPIRWVQYGGRKHPIDPEPSEKGNLLVSSPEQLIEGRVAPAVVVYLPKREAAEHTGPLYASHYSTCPNAAQFRR